MANIAKRNKVSSYYSYIQNSPNFVLIGFEKASHKKIEDIRKELRSVQKEDDKVELKVIKNSLLALALKKNKLDSLIPSDKYKGQTMLLTLGVGNWLSVLSLYYKKAKKEGEFSFKSGYLDGTYYSQEELIRLSELPSKEELVFLIIRSLKSSQHRIAFSLKYPMTRLVNVLKQVKTN